MTLDFNKYQKDSTLIWLVNNVRLPKKLPWAFEDRPWQIQIMEDKSKYITCRKPTQIGMSTVFLGKMLHFADTYPSRSMFTLPRQDDVYDMVNSRLDEMVRESPYLKEQMGIVDNVRMKKFGDSWIHFAEMSVPPRMMDVDWMVNDEVDFSDPDHLEQASSRMDASDYGHHHKIGTPSIDGYGVDAIFDLSDQKHWIVKCPYCLFEQNLTWEGNVVHTEKDGAYYVCSSCHNKLRKDDIRNGQWVSFGPENSLYSGYQINHLMVPRIDPNKIWAESKTMSPKNFYNYRLGLPYTPSSGSITLEMLETNCFNYNHETEVAAVGGKTYVMGADQGDEIHVVVASIDNKDGGISIVYGNKLSFEEGFRELDAIARKFNVAFAVIDALPNHHSAKKLVDTMRSNARIAYFTTSRDLYVEKDDDNKININKTDAYDLVVERIVTGNLQLPSRSSAGRLVVGNIITHMTNMRRDIVEAKARSGGVVVTHVWKAVGPDHYADAVLYAVIAADVYTTKGRGFSIVDLDNIEQFWEENGVAFTQKEEPTEEVIRLTPSLAPTNPYMR